VFYIPKPGTCTGQFEPFTGHFTHVTDVITTCLDCFPQEKSWSDHSVFYAWDIDLCPVFPKFPACQIMPNLCQIACQMAMFYPISCLSMPELKNPPNALMVGF
jgi:hypothetical protein